MKLRTIVKGERHDICVPLKEGRSELLDFLREQEQAGHRAHVAGLRLLFERYAKQGRQGLTAEQCHLADKQKNVWEFRKGALRIYFVVENKPDGRGRLVLLSHGIVKKHQKAKSSDKEAAERLRTAYQKALEEGGLEIE